MLPDIFKHMKDMEQKIFPPGIDDTTKDLIKKGLWSCSKTDAGFIVKTVAYSSCCNPKGQSIYYFSTDGTILNIEHGVK